MATTTNYGWDTPDDTDLVKDGAAAIRTLGSSVDTTTKALNPSTTLGDIEYRSATANTNTRLAVGANGQVLSVSSGVPAWVNPAGGMDLITEAVLSASTGYSFSSIPQTYKQLLLIWGGIQHSTTATEWSIRLNANSSSIYNVKALRGTNATTNNTTLSRDSIDTSGAVGAFGYNTSQATIQELPQGTLLIDNYASTTKFKRFNCTYGFYDNTANERFTDLIGWFSTTTAVTSIDITRLTGAATISNIADTSVRLYGVS
jgi:hypothetical protein